MEPNSNSLVQDAIRYRWLRQHLEYINFEGLTVDTSDVGLDFIIDVRCRIDKERIYRWFNIDVESNKMDFISEGYIIELPIGKFELYSKRFVGTQPTENGSNSLKMQK